jgi:hypothetical protein
VGAHRYVSAVSAEIAGGTLPEKRLPLRALRHSVPIRRVKSAGRSHGRRCGAQKGQPGERRDAREDRAGEAVSVQAPERAQQRHAPKMAQPLRSRGAAGAASAASPAAQRGRT